MGKKQRLVWTTELHNRFINAITHLVRAIRGIQCGRGWQVRRVGGLSMGRWTEAVDTEGGAAGHGKNRRDSDGSGDCCGAYKLVKPVLGCLVGCRG